MLSMASNFKTLKVKWDLILADTGFRDIEEYKNGEYILKQYASNVYRGADAITREAKLEYFLTVSANIQMTKFKNKTEEFILTRYSEGISQNEIEMLLIKRRTKRHLDTVHRTIQRYLTRWGLKH